MDKFELKITQSCSSAVKESEIPPSAKPTNSYTEERSWTYNEFGEDVDCEPYQHTTNYVSAEIIINNQKSR